MAEQRRVKQTVRIRVECELPADDALCREGDRPVIEPARKRVLVALLKWVKPIEGSFPEIATPPPESGRAAP